MFEQEIEKYENVRMQFQKRIADNMDADEWMEYNEILFSCHSCAIEGNSFSVDDTRILREQGMRMVPVGRSLLECAEMADHFRAFEYMTNHLSDPLSESLIKEINRLVTQNTLPFKVKGAVPGEYTTQDMAAGDTIFGSHQQLIARVPHLVEATTKALYDGVHPVVAAAKFHGYFEYLHPFRDGNGRTGRLLSNFLLLKAGHPLLIVKLEDRENYISALRMIRTEGTDEYLTSFFFRVAIERMQHELEQKKRNSRQTFLF